MAMKKESGAKKPMAKMASKAKTTSRGSNSKVQVGNENQREAVRQKGNPAFAGDKTYRPTKTMATSARGKLDQRAGGSKNLSEKEMIAKGNSRRAKASRGR
jgi:hypothetical protein